MEVSRSINGYCEYSIDYAKRDVTFHIYFTQSNVYMARCLKISLLHIEMLDDKDVIEKLIGLFDGGVKMERVWKIMHTVNENIEGKCYHKISIDDNKHIFFHCYKSEENYFNIDVRDFYKYSDSFITLMLIDFCKENEK